MAWASSPWAAPCGKRAAAASSWPAPRKARNCAAFFREAVIYVLDGLFPGQAEFYAQNNLLPALISTEEAREWAAFGRVYGRKLPCAIHVDTGINRLGFPIREYTALLAETATMEGLNVSLLMSHLACAEEATPSPHPETARHLQRRPRQTPRRSRQPRQFQRHFPGQGLRP